MIQLVNVSKTYSSKFALSDVSLNIASEKSTVLLGTSGSGKSTLLKLMNGLVYPDPGGQVFFKHRLLTSTNIVEHRRKMGYVLQEGGLFPHLTARSNVSLMARYLRWDSRKIDERINELASLTQLEDEGLLDRYPSQLATGQRQRISLMRALFLDPELLLLDEPLGALDPLLRTDLQNDLIQIFRRLKKTVVLVTHDISEAWFFGDFIVFMNKGKIVLSGEREEIAQAKDPFIKRFIGAQKPPFGKN